jgi:hypothetical protein
MAKKFGIDYELAGIRGKIHGLAKPPNGKTLCGLEVKRYLIPKAPPGRKGPAYGLTCPKCRAEAAP